MVVNKKDNSNIVGNEIVMYQTEDGHTKLMLNFEDETVWLMMDAEISPDSKISIKA